jgi:hydroxybutyrate-dimer hydrolase
VTGGALTGKGRAYSAKIARGIRSIRASGDLKGLPAIVVTGRSDAILPINHTSRAYYGLNQIAEGARSNLRYYEITNAHHLDVFNKDAFVAFGSTFNQMFIPLHHYLFVGLDLMYDHLNNGTTLPPSQVVDTVPRGAGAPPLAPVNVPPIADVPGAREITFNGNLLAIPD